MFYCKSCGSRVQVLLPHLKVVGFPVLGKAKLGVSHVTLLPSQQGTSEIRTTFFCSVCQEELDLTAVVSECSHCFVMREVKDLTVFSGYPGMYCEEHSELVKNDTGLTPDRLSNNIQTVEIKGGN